MYLKGRLRSACKTVLGRLAKQGKTRTNLNELYQEFEKSNTLNIDEIQYILNWIQQASVEERYKLVKEYYRQIEYRKKNKEKAKEYSKKYYEANKEKHRKIARESAKRNYKRKKK